MKLFFFHLCCSGRSTSAAENGNWRSGDRPKAESPPPQRRSNNRYGNRDSRSTREDAAPSEERPRLKLQPRTVPFGMFVKFSFLCLFLLK